MAVNYSELREILERKANKAIGYLDELKCFVPEFREVLDSVLYISETLKDLNFLDTECTDCKKRKKIEKELSDEPMRIKGWEDIVKDFNYIKLDEAPDQDRIVLFHSNSCVYCNYLKPILEMFAKLNNIHLEIIDIDTEQGNLQAEKYGIQSWPTVFAVKDNVIVNLIIGANPELSTQKTMDLLKGYILDFLKGE